MKQSLPLARDEPALPLHRSHEATHDEEVSNGPALRTNKTGTSSSTLNPTTSFLTSATLVYTIRAGITAAAGTRLAL